MDGHCLHLTVASLQNEVLLCGLPLAIALIAAPALAAAAAAANSRS